MVGKSNVSDSDTKATEKKADDGVRHFIYIGPSLPGGRLQKNAVLRGTHSEITAYFQSAIDEFPQVAKLIIPVGKLKELGAKTQTSGNLMYNYYQEITAEIKAKGEEK